jgi:hypothetical protein
MGGIFGVRSWSSGRPPIGLIGCGDEHISEMASRFTGDGDTRMRDGAATDSNAVIGSRRQTLPRRGRLPAT